MPSRRACNAPQIPADTSVSASASTSNKSGGDGCDDCNNQGKYGRGTSVCGKCGRCHGCGSSNNGIGPLQATYFGVRSLVRKVGGGGGGAKKEEGEGEGGAYKNRFQYALKSFLPPPSVNLSEHFEKQHYMSALSDEPKGYFALAHIMGLGSGTAMFKRFAQLNLHSLLIQQAELLDLQRQLDVAISVDKGRGLHFDTIALDLIEAGKDGINDEQWKLVMQIREKLRTYNEALLHQAQIGQMPCPGNHDYTVLRKWLRHPKGGNLFLKGVEDLPWLEEERDDLVAVSSRNFDTLTKLVAEKVVPWSTSRRVIKKTPLAGQEELGLLQWNDEAYETASRLVSILTATLIPSLAIIILYFIRNLIARILTAMGMSFVFSILLAATTAARPAEIFASTAAFSAVQVVFIGSTSVTI
ncbi:hypothetical protein Q7P37_008641 [Cladosporium fusiforme]